MTRDSQFGKDYKVKEYKPSAFNDISQHNTTVREFKPENKDTLKPAKYKPTNFEPTRQSYEYKPYKPSQVGMYGEKEKQTKKPISKPSPRVGRQATEKAKQPAATGRKLNTFKSYDHTLGPDIKLGNTGPDMRVKEYKYKDPDLLSKPMEKPYREPIKPNFLYENRTAWTPKRHGDYKLTERNNLGMRHFHNNGFVDDTIMRSQTEKKGTKRFIMVPKTPEEKPLTKKPKTPGPVIAKNVPIVAAPPPHKKKFVNSSTQHVTPGNKTSQTQTNSAPVKAIGTQYEKSKSKHMNIQTDTPQPLPPVVAAGAVLAHPQHKVTSKSKSVQASEPQKKVAVAGTQYTGPKTKQATIQTSPVVFATQTRGPIPVQARQRSPEPMVDQRSPSPQAAPSQQSYTPPRQSRPAVVPIVVPMQQKPRQYTPTRSNTPKQTTPPRQTTPPNEVWREPTPPSENTASPVNTPPRINSPPHVIAPVIVPVTTSHQPSYRAPETPKRHSPVSNWSPDGVKSPSSPPPVIPVVVPVQQSSNNPYVFQPAKIADTQNQSYAPAPAAQRPPTPVSAGRPPLTPQSLSPDRMSPAAHRETMHPQPAYTQAVPLLHKPYIDPIREEATPKFSSSSYGDAFQPYTGDRRMRLPPEVNACIEAYDNAHSDPIRGSGESLPTIKRTMNFA